jgi:glycosyltransferase involved in cell wall biosynthesis
MSKTKADLPLVSICVPIYNGAQFIVEALNLCKSQDYPNLELVISDDESADGTIELVEKFFCDFPLPLKILSHIPSGIGANWNNCIKHANGKYIKFLFQDDLLEPNCISELVNLIESHPNVALAGSKRKIILEDQSSENDNWLSKYSDLQLTLEKNECDVYELTKRDFSFSFFYEGPLNKIGEPSSVLFKRDCLNTVGYFRNDLNQVLDIEYWWRVMEKHTVLISEKSLSSFRLHTNQATNKNKSNFKKDYLSVKTLIISKYLWKMPMKESLKVISKEVSWIRKNLSRKLLKG